MKHVVVFALGTVLLILGLVVAGVLALSFITTTVATVIAAVIALILGALTLPAEEHRR